QPSSTSTMTASPTDSNDLTYESLPDANEGWWEKSVEFAFSRWLEMWRLEESVKKISLIEVKELLKSKGLCESISTTVPVVSEMVLKAIHASRSRPAYFPLDGNAESGLGDALVRAKKFLLIECKNTIDISELEREAYPTSYLRKNQVVKEGNVPNPGGKDRRRILKKIRKDNQKFRNESIEAIGRKCHFLVGMDRTKKVEEISYADYWPFILGENGDEIPKYPIQEIVERGADYQEFMHYIMALLEFEDGKWEQDAHFLHREMVLAIFDPMDDERAIEGHCISRSELANTMQDIYERIQMRGKEEAAQSKATRKSSVRG
ncbi:MAG: hypothetical protein QM686_02775, partial [Herbaspirillum sp.]